MYSFLKNQKKKILIVLITTIMMITGATIIPAVSTVIAVEGNAPVITPLSIDSSGRISGEITTNTNISFKVEDNNQITNFYYLWDKNIAGNTTYQKISANQAKVFTAQIPTSSIPKTLGVHELSVYASNGKTSSLVKTIPYYVVNSLTGTVDNNAPTLVMPTTTVLTINQKLSLKYTEKETAIYRIRYEWSTNSEREFENAKTVYKPADGIVEIQTPSTPGIYYLKTDGTDASNKTYEGAVIAFDIRKELNPPTINGVGSTEVFHQKGTEYIYPEVTATDDTDGTVQVNRTSDLDINKVGNYTITYTATDSSKNQARIDVIVHVVDYSSLDEQLDKIKDLDETDYDKETWDKLQEEIQKAEDLKDTNQSLQDKIDEIVENIKDIIAETQKPENIKTPTITNIEVTAPEYIKVGDKITFTFNTDTKIDEEQTITINGVDVDVTLKGEFPNYIAEVTIPENNKIAEGPINYTFQAEKTLTTVAGETITKKSEPQEGTLENIKLDKTKPTITFKDTVKFDENGNAYIELLAKDSFDREQDYTKYIEITDNTGILAVSGAGDVDTNVPQTEAYVITYIATDLAGNVSEITTLNIYVKDYIESIELAQKADGTQTKTTYTYGQTVQKQDVIANITMAGGTKYEAVSLSDEAISSIQNAITLSVDSQNAGDRTVTITYKTKTAESTLGDRNLTYNITIEKATYNIEEIQFKDKKNNEIVENGTIAYDGTVQTVVATNLPKEPAGLSILDYTYKNSKGEIVTEVKNAGTYTVTVNFQVADSDNFEVPASITRTFEITKKELSIADLEITKPSAPIYYDETKTVEVGIEGKTGIEGLGTIVKKYYKVTEEGETLVTEADGITPASSVKTAGTYKVKISLNNEENYTITAGELEVATFEIKKAQYNIEGKYTFTDGTANYDGQVKTIADPTLPQGVTILNREYKDASNKLGNAVNAGAYTVILTLGLTEEYTKNYEDVTPKTITANLVINPMEITTLDQIKELVDITENITGLVYNKAPQNAVTAVAKADKKGVGTPVITYYQGETKLAGAPTNAGEYTAKISLAGATNYEIANESKEIEVVTFTIEKNSYDMQTLQITGQTQEYDGTAKKLTVTGLPEGVKATIIYKDSQGNTITGPVNAGTGYTAEITFVGDEINYNTIAPRTENMVVEAKELSLSDLSITLPTAPIEYKENDVKQVTVTPKTGIQGLGTLTLKYYKVTEDGETLVETNGNPSEGVINAGKYKVKVSITGASNYKITAGELEVATFEIQKASYDMTEIIFGNKTTTYDGTVKTIEEIANLPTGVICESYTYKDKEGNTITNIKDAGTYTVVANLTYDTENYQTIPEQKATLTINKRKVTITADNKTSVYGNTLENLTYQITEGSIVTGDRETVTLTTSATETPVVGTYPITGTVTISDNYEITFVAGTYEITRKLLTLEDLKITMPYNLDTETVIYNRKPKAVKVEAKEGIVGIGAITVYYYPVAEDGTEGKATTEAQVNAGTYKVRVQVAEGTNYTASGTVVDGKFVPGPFDLDDLVINKRTAKVAIGDQSSIYGDAISTDISKVITEHIEGDDLGLTVTPVLRAEDGTETELTAETPAGTYTIKGTATNQNYNVEFTEGTYTINPKSLQNVTIEVKEPKDLVYSNSGKEVTVELTTTINKKAYTLNTNGNEDYTAEIKYFEQAGPEDTETIEIGNKKYKEIENIPTEVGTYIAKLTLTGKGNFAGTKVLYSKEYNITKAVPKYEKPTGLKATYGALLSSVELPEGFTFENMTESTLVGDAGIRNFTVKYTPTDTKNYSEVTGIEVTIEVSKATYKLENYNIQPEIIKDFEEGVKQTIVEEVEGTTQAPKLPAGIKVTYNYIDKEDTTNTSTDGMINYGTYKVEVTFSIDEKGPLFANYSEVAPKTLETTLKISKATYKLEENVGTITFEGNTNPTYDGTSKTLTVKNTIDPKEISISYEYYPADENGQPIIAEKLTEAPKSAGSYIVRAKFELVGSGTLIQNYNAINPSSKDARITIAKKAPEVSDLKITIPYTDTVNKKVIYDGQEKSVTVEPKDSTIIGLGDTIKVQYYKVEGNKETLVVNEDGTPATSVKDIGTYNVKVAINEGDNYLATPVSLLDLGETNRLVIEKRPLENSDIDLDKVSTTVEYGEDVRKAVENTIKTAIKEGVTANIKSITWNGGTTMPTEASDTPYELEITLEGTGNYSEIATIRANCTIRPRQITADDITITEPTSNLVYSKDKKQPVSTVITTNINGTDYTLQTTDVTITTTYYVETLETNIPEADKIEVNGKTYKKVVGEPENAGTYIAKVTAEGLGNFRTGVNAEKYSNPYTIEKAMYKLDKTLSLTDATITYDGAPHKLELPSDDRTAGLNISYTYNGQSVQNVTNAGIYKVIATFTLTEELSKNYLDTELLTEKIEATLTIEKDNENEPVVKLVDSQGNELTYNEDLKSYVIKITEPNPSISIENSPKYGTTVDITANKDIITINEETKVIELNKNGEVTIKVVFPESTNYNANSKEVKLTINLDGLTAEHFELSDNTYTYDATGKQAVITPKLQEVETGKITTYYCKVTNDTPDMTNKLTAPVNAGEYAVFVENAGGTKYQAVETPIKLGTLTINKRQVTITADDKTSVYRDNLAKLTYTITPGTGLDKALVGTDKETVTLTTNATPTSAVSGTYEITGTYSISDNYDITFRPGTYTLTKRVPVKEDLSITMPSNLEYNKEAKTVTVVPNPATGETLETKGLGNIKVYYGDTEVAPKDVGTYKIRVEIAEGENYFAMTEVLNLPDLIITPRPATVTITPAPTSKFGEEPVAIVGVPANVIEGDDLGLSLTANVTAESPVGNYDIAKVATNNNYNVTYLPEGIKYVVTANPVETIRVIAPTTNLSYTENTEHPVTVEVLDPTKTDGTLLTEKTAEQTGDYTKIITYYQLAKEGDLNTETINGKEYKKITGTPVNAGTYIAKAEVTGLGNYETETPVVGYSAEYTISKANQEAPVVELHKTLTTGEQPELNKIDGQYVEKITETNKIMAVVAEGKGNTTYSVDPANIIEIDKNGVIKLLKAGEVTITVTYEGNENYNPNSSTVSLKVIKDTLKTGDYAIKENTDEYTYDGTAKKVELIPTIKVVAEDVGTVTEHYYKVTENDQIETVETINPTHAGKYAIFITTTGGNKYEAVTTEKTVGVQGYLIINPKSATVTIEEPTTKYGETVVNPINFTETGAVTIDGVKDDLGITLRAEVTESTPVGEYEIVANATNPDYDVTFVPEAPVYTIIANPVKVEDINIQEPAESTYTEGTTQEITVTVKDPSDSSKTLTEKVGENAGDYTQEITYYKKVEDIPAGTPASSIYQDENGNKYVKLPEGVLPENAGTYIAKVEITGLGNFATTAPVVKYSKEFVINKAEQDLPTVKLQKTQTIGDPIDLPIKDGVYEVEITSAGKVVAVVSNEGIGSTTFEIITAEGEEPLASINAKGEITVLKAGQATIKVAFAETENYKEKAVEVKLNIIKGVLTEDDLAVVETDVHTYDGTPKKVEIKATIPQLAEGDIGEITTYYIKTKNPDGTEVTNGTRIEAPIDAGEYAIYVEVSEGNKYNEVKAPNAIAKGTMTIAQRKIVITADNQKGVYKDPVNLDQTKYKVTPGEGLTEALLNGDKAVVTLETSANETSPVGTYPITVKTVEISQNYTVIKRDGTFEITKRTPALSDLVVTMPYDSQDVTTITYNNKPKVVVVEKAGNTVGLGGQGTPITVNYYELDVEGNVKPNTKTTVAPIKAGSYKVTVDITEGDNYLSIEDLYVVTFEISKKQITEADIVIEVPIDAEYEEGIGHPVDVKNPNGVTYTKTITYVNTATGERITTPPVNAGTYKAEVAITGTGDYAGEFTITSAPYTVEKAEQDMEGVALSKTSVLMTESAPTIKLNGKAKGEITYALVPNFGEDTVQENVIQIDSDGKITLLGKGKVTIEVRYAETANYKQGVAKLELNVAKDTLNLSNMTIDIASKYTYNGQAQTVEVTSELEGIGEITVTYEQNGQKVTPVDAGTYDIVINVSETAKYNGAELKATGLLVIDPVIITDANKDTYLTYKTVYSDSTKREVNYQRNYTPDVNVSLKPEYQKDGANSDVNISTLYNNGAFELRLNQTYTVTAHMEDSKNFKFAKDINIYTFKIVDIEAPTITTVNGNGSNKMTIDKTPTTTIFDYEKYIKVTDNYSESGNITLLPIEGDKVDTSKIGTYVVIYKAVDENGNVARFELEVEVINGPPLIFYRLPAQTEWYEMTKDVAEGYVKKELRTIPTINWLHGEVVIMRKHIDSLASDPYTETYYASAGKAETTKIIEHSGWYKITVSDGGRSTTREIKVDIRMVEVILNNAPREKTYYEDVHFVIQNERDSYITKVKIEDIDNLAPEEIVDLSKHSGGTIELDFKQDTVKRRYRVTIEARNGETKTVTFQIMP